MRAEGDRRWQALARTLRSALIEHDLVGLRGMAKLPHSDKTEGFGIWLHEELRQKVIGIDGRWLKPYVVEAASKAQSRATELAPGGVVDPSRVASMGALAVSELQGICAAAQQQIVRVVTHCLAASASPTRTANKVASVIATMRARTRAMSEYIVAKTHATSTLSAFRNAGVTHVGVDPERLRKKREVKQTAHGLVLVKDVDLNRFKQDQHVFDAGPEDEPRDPHGRWTSGSGDLDPKDMQKDRWKQGETAYFEYHCLMSPESADAELWYRSQQPVTVGKVIEKGYGKNFMARMEAGAPRVYEIHFKDGYVGHAVEDELLTHPGFYNYGGSNFSPPTQEQIERYRKYKDALFDRDVEQGEDVDVITAGDNDVCLICEDISDNGPYELDDAEQLIPAHPFCRCGFVPLSDKRFASVHEFDYDPNEPRDPHGRWAAASNAAGIAGNDPGDPHNARVSTRVPAEKVRRGELKGQQLLNVHTDPNVLQVGIESSKGDTENFHKNMDIVRSYDFLKISKNDNDDTVASKFIAFAKSNILALYNKTDKAVRELSKLWYDGAHTYADKLGADHGVPLRVAAGVIAALSPQKDWDMNADMARRVMDMWKNRKDEQFTDQTEAYARQYLAGLKKSADTAKTEKAKISRLHDWRMMSGWVDDFRGKSLGDFDNDTTELKQATLMRWLDEGKNLADPLRANYRVFSPDGTMGDVARNDPNKAQAKAGLPGDPGKIAWQTYKAIDSAIHALKHPTRAGISEALGDNHKVRSFYNNIMHPDDPHGDVTIDTHAIAAAIMHPVAGKDTITAQGLGGAGSKSVKTGAKGLYGLYAEAYRQAAKEKGILPRQMQSIVWESIRGVWSPAEKRDDEEIARVNRVWKSYKNGRIDQQSAQDQITVRGIADPVWFKRSSSGHDSTRSSIDAGIIHDRELSGYRSRGLDSRDDGGDSANTALDFDPDQPRDPKGSSTGGRWSKVAGEVGHQFISPNVGSGDFAAARKELNSPRQKALDSASMQIDAALKLGGMRSDAIGAWADGAENSIVTRFDFNPDWDKLKLSAAMKGYLADQKSVLAFKQADEGKAVLYHMLVQEPDLQKLHENLLANGLAFHTIVPHTTGEGEPVLDKSVYVADLDGSAHDAMAKAAERYKADVDYQFGRAEFIGTQKQDGTDREQRDDARRAYAEIIGQSPVSQSQAIWERVHNQWGETLGIVSPGELDTRVTNVGGDEWNKQTAVRLESEYQHVKPELEQLAAKAVGQFSELSAQPSEWKVVPAWKGEGFAIQNAKGDYGLTPSGISEAHFSTEVEAQEAIKQYAPTLPKHEGDDDEDEDIHEPKFVPDSWDEIGDTQQEEIKNSWMEHTADEFLQQEISSWQDSGNALDDTKSELAYKGPNQQYVMDALVELDEERKEEREADIPFTRSQLIDAMLFEYEATGEGQKDVAISWDDSKLTEPKGLVKEQLSFPGIEPAHPSYQLTNDMRKAIEAKLIKAFNKEADDKVSDTEPPEYLKDNIEDFQSDVWESKHDKEKFEWAVDNGHVEDPTKAPKAETTKTLTKLPDKFDPIGEKDTTEDYKLTKLLASEMSIERAADVLMKRGVFETRDAARRAASTFDNRLWSSWKGDSASADGLALQAATAAELGGRWRGVKEPVPFNMPQIVKNVAPSIHPIGTYTVFGFPHSANSQFATKAEAEKAVESFMAKSAQEKQAPSITKMQESADDRFGSAGGWEGLKAYVRSKWEVSQYLLDKANMPMVDVYRGILMKDKGRMKAERVQVKQPDYPVPFKHIRLPEVTLERNGAQSATTDISVANKWNGAGVLKSGFDPSTDRVVFRMRVPRTAVLSLPAYGQNHMNEHEVVVAGTAWQKWDAWDQQAPKFDDAPV